MTKFTDRYYPTICIRRAEMKAMENLPHSEKLKMLPIVLLAPWLNSIKFENTFDIISKSVGDIPIIVDIDRYFSGSSNLPSRVFFNSLCDPTTGPELWIKLIRDHQNYIPCIQILKTDKRIIRWQIEIAKELNRGFVFRIEIDRENNINEIFDIISENCHDDLLVIFDYGYKDSSFDIEMKLTNLIDRLLTISPDMKFVVAGASFPNSFSQFDDFSESKPISARMIYGNLARKYGNSKFFYGDWASTKPRSYDGGGSSPRPRIDFPIGNSWIIARSAENDWDFQDAAERITRLPEWESRPIIWGTGLIEKTAKGLPGAISTGPASIASRVNIHLYTQNNFGVPTQTSTPQGKWIDPI